MKWCNSLPFADLVSVWRPQSELRRYRDRHLARVCINIVKIDEWSVNGSEKRTVDALFTHLQLHTYSIFNSLYFYATANKKSIWCAYIYFPLLLLLGRRRIEKWRKISSERLVTGYEKTTFITFNTCPGAPHSQVSKWGNTFVAASFICCFCLCVNSLRDRLSSVESANQLLPCILLSLQCFCCCIVFQYGFANALQTS